MGVRTWASGVRRRSDDKRRARQEEDLYQQYSQREFDDGAALLDAHFSTWSQPDHVNRQGFEAAFALMNDQPQVILETGTSAWGTDSTRLWDAYVRRFGGEFWSVDLSANPSQRLASQVCDRTHLIVDDSVHFLSTFASLHHGEQVGVCYLDSWDLDWADPDPAAAHGLAEFHAVAPLLGPGSVLVIDDSPGSLDWVPADRRADAERYAAERGYLPGKGALAHQELVADPRVRVVWHGYNTVYQYQS